MGADPTEAPDEGISGGDRVGQFRRMLRRPDNGEDGVPRIELGRLGAAVAADEGNAFVDTAVDLEELG